MSVKKKSFTVEKNQTCFVPLGGCGMFGSNLSLYHTQGKWLMVDCGMGFADETMPGVDLLLPDPSFVEQIKDDLIGLVITHGHEDHVGGIEHLWRRFQCPIYATPFTAEFIRQKLSEHGWASQVPLHEVECGGQIDLAPFQIQMIKMCHSIPEMQALAIDLPDVGTVLHTGDWKLDDAPVEGHITDEDSLKKLGDKGVFAILGDSTNAMVPGRSGSEHSVLENLSELFGEFKNGQIVVSCFSSNVARLKSVAVAAAKNGRQVGLVGRSLWRMNNVARKTGYLSDVPDFLMEEEMLALPEEKRLFICTGSQGEPRAALTKIANGEHPRVRVGAGDVVMFSALDIPGNEKSISRLRNRLRARSAEVITKYDAPIHVSGHPYRDELKQMIGWVKPQNVIPVHGEQMQMEKHADLARECGVSAIYIPHDGQVVCFDKDKGVHQIGEVRAGMLALEGKRLVPMEYEAIQVRKRIMFHGSAVITVVVDGSGALLADPQISAMGLIDEDCEVENETLTDVVEHIRQTVDNMPKSLRKLDEQMAEKIRIATRRHLEGRFDKKPQTRVHLVRI